MNESVSGDWFYRYCLVVKLEFLHSLNIGIIPNFLVMLKYDHVKIHVSKTFEVTNFVTIPFLLHGRYMWNILPRQPYLVDSFIVNFQYT